MKTIVNGKEIKLFSDNEISKIYTEKVKEFLNEGYNFYFYSGTQGEEVKTCLTNDSGKTVFILFVDSRYESLKEIKSIYIKKYEDVYTGQILWLNKGETVFQKDFYCVSEKRSGDIFVENEDDFETLNKITSERRNNHYKTKEIKNHIELSETCYKTALKIIRKRQGYKSVQLKDIKKITHRIGYGYEFDLGNYKKNFSIKTVR